MGESEADVALTIGAVAQRLGIAVPTLRSWDRRYGLGPGSHDEGRHRRYTTEDLARLDRMIALRTEGVPPAVAAELAQGGTTTDVPARDGGGSGALAVGRADSAVRGLARAAQSLDVARIHDTVARHLGERGVVRTWDEILTPLLRTFGDHFDLGDDVVASEHAATVGILRALHGVPVPAQSRRLPALLACVAEEQHTLPLEALHAALSERGCPARFLGARMPHEALLQAVRRLRPRNLVLWAHTARCARKIDVAALTDTGTRVVVAGSGWSARVVASDGVARPDSLDDACDEVMDGALRTR
ncbi:MerR family transcriptional regulator [Allosaccharopolyspora coralli]|uniref:MerR family transcriptional regulator n=1 Tax=Allosaccharopolyspora coralli TaxID=2665642 RepID=A0A5Q3QG57_9PSEU|nr:MerR family transcriptional regulator [Allosaccharopolyspora coralli]QGK70449.1 MerR family transcriptional regulator [Allosaccharopolyspora coralli]